MLKQNLLLNSSDISIVTNVSNDLYMNFQNTLFKNGPISLKLLLFKMDPKIVLFGNTNNNIIITYNSIEYSIVLDYSRNIFTDDDLALCIATALNTPSYTGESIDIYCRSRFMEKSNR